jgi:exonuclease SbcD
VLWLVEVVRDEHIDLVAIAGDLYDRAIPPAESVVLMRELLLQLRALGVTVVAIAGNHDGAERVSAYDGLVDAASIYLRGGYSRAGGVLTLPFNDGPLDIVAVPYLDPILAPAEPALTVSDVESERTRRTHQSVLVDALAKASQHRSSPRSIVIAHAFVTGGEVSESERLLTVGGTGQVDISIFDGFSYVALGHLHRPQQVGSTTRRYSGTPLPYSFSEQHSKQIVIVDIDAAGVCDVSELTVPVGRAVATVSGTMSDLLESAQHDLVVDRFIRAVVTDVGQVIDAKSRLRDRFPFVIEVLLQPPVASGDREGVVGATDRARLSPLEAAEAFWLDVTNEAPGESEHEVLESILTRAALEANAR